jgi:hypothetical protein
MNHTSLSRTAHVFAIDRLGSDNRRFLLPGRRLGLTLSGAHQTFASACAGAFAIALRYGCNSAAPTGVPLSVLLVNVLLATFSTCLRLDTVQRRSASSLDTARSQTSQSAATPL